MHTNSLVCDACGTENESFLNACPHCGATEFRRPTAGGQHHTSAERAVVDEVARLTRPLNPLPPV